MSRARPWLLVVLALLAGHALAPQARPYQLAAPLIAWLSHGPRLCAWLGAPLQRAPVARADERSRAARASAALQASAAGDAVRRALLEAARPTRPELLEGRHLAPAEVLGRSPASRDRIRLRLTSDARGIQPGFPVVHGNHYVGRVRAVLDAAQGELEAELISGADVFVGARPALWPKDAGSAWVVGGLARPDPLQVGGLPPLALHHPHPHAPRSGYVVCDESLSEREPFGILAEGYGLGRLVASEGRALAVEAQLDFRDGLSQLHVLCPPQARRGAEAPLADPLGDHRWLRARVLALADASPARAGLVLEGGRLRGVHPGAAVLSNGALVGRVLQARERDAEVALFGDSGLQLLLVARAASESTPVVLGRAFSRARARPSTPPCLWWPTREPAWLAMPAGERFELFSAAGDAGLPAGLWLGEGVLLARSDAGLEFELRAPRFDPLDVWVRLESAGEP